MHGTDLGDKCVSLRQPRCLDSFILFLFLFFLSSAIHYIHTNTRAWPPRPPKKTNKTKTKNPPSVFPLSHQPLFVSSTTFFCFVLFCFLNISFCRANIRNEMFGPIVRARTQESTRTGSVKQSARGGKGWNARAPKKKKKWAGTPSLRPEGDTAPSVSRRRLHTSCEMGGSFESPVREMLFSVRPRS